MVTTIIYALLLQQRELLVDMFTVTMPVAAKIMYIFAD
jgi:hypothetical protein